MKKKITIALTDVNRLKLIINCLNPDKRIMNPFKVIRFMKNQKKKDMLVLNGKYTMSKDGKTNFDGSTRWKCTNRNVCTATVTLNKDKTKIIRETVHKCNINDNSLLIKELLNNIKKEVCNNLKSVQEIFEDMVTEFKECHPDCPVYDLPTYSSVRPTLYRARKRFLDSDTLCFKKLEDVRIPKGLREKFTVIEDGNEEKIIIMCSRKSLKTLRCAKSISYYGDGTFHVTPRPFYQLYILHLDVYSNKESIHVYPVIYAFLPNKTQRTYTRLFSLIKNELKVNMRLFKCDYEIAPINAVKQIYEDVKITGCYHHYNKAIWDMAKKLEIIKNKKKTTNKFVVNKSERNIVRLCSYFVLLPSIHMQNTWQAIKDIAPNTTKMHLFMKYFRDTWYNKDHNLLSCADDVHRTTNSCEGYHRKLKSRLPKTPNIFLIWHTIQKEAHYFDRKIERGFFLPFQKNRRRTDIIFDRKYKKLLNKLDKLSISPLKFLQNIIFTRLKLGKNK